MRKLKVLLLLLMILLTACNQEEPTVFEPVSFELPQIAVEADEVPTGYYKVYNLETNELIYENLSVDEVSELDLTNDYETHSVYAIPTFIIALEQSEVETLVPTTSIAETGSDGIATFENVMFNEAGTFTYTVWQTAETDEFEHWELDDSIHTFTIEVTENEELEILEATLVDEVDFIFINLFTYEAEEIEENLEDENDTLDEDDDETNTSDVPETTETTTSANTNNNSATLNNNSNNISNNNNTPTQNVVNNNNTANNNNNTSTNNQNNQSVPSTPTPPPAQVCRSIWIETSPAVAGTPDTIGQLPHYYVQIVLPNRTEFREGQGAERDAYMLANNQTSFTTARRGGGSYVIPGIPSTPAQGHYEERCD